MGIKYFNKYLRQQCTKKAIRRISLESLKGKTIVIDVSIFLYRFKKKQALIECMFLMISLFIYYDIRPLFVFDGQPPEEKQELLWQRFYKKREAREKVKELKEQQEEQDDELKRQIAKLEKGQSEGTV